MKDNSRDGAAVWLPPPLVYLAGLVLGFVLHAFVVPLGIPIATAPRIVIAVLTAMAGVVLVAGAIRLFKRTGQDPKPWKATPEIVSSGVYRWTRNPMYVGMALIQAAIGIGVATGWIVVLTPLVLGVVYLTAVRHEETYLEQKFGAAYTEYKNEVRRWL